MNPDWQSTVDDIIANNLPRSREPGEFSVYDFIARLKDTRGLSLTVNSAYRLLQKMVDRGQLGTRADVHDFDGRRRRMYGPAQGGNHLQTP